METREDIAYLDKQYSKGELDNAEKRLKAIMSADELKEYSNLSAEEKKYFLSGFLDNIELYKKACNQQPGGGGGQPPHGNDPKKHLPVWMGPNSQKTTPDDPNGRQGMPIKQDIQDAQQQSQDMQKNIDDLNKLAGEIQKASEDLQNANGSNVKEKMEKLKDLLDKASKTSSATAQQAEKLSDMADDILDKMGDAVEDIKKMEKQQEENRLSGKGNNGKQGGQKQQNGNGTPNGSGDDGSSMDSDGMSGQPSGSSMSGKSSNGQSGQSSGSMGGSPSGTGDMGGDPSGSNDMGNDSGMSNAGSKVSTSSKASTLYNKAHMQTNSASQESGQTNLSANNVSRDEAMAKRAMNRMNANANNGNNVNSADMEAAVKAAEDAMKDAQKTAQNAQKVSERVDKVSEHAKAVDKMREDMANGMPEQEKSPSIFNTPVLYQPPKVADEAKKLTGRHEYDRSNIAKMHRDMISHEEAMEIAERAGYELDSDDKSTPEQLATRKLTKVHDEIKDTTGWHGQGYGNSPLEVIDTLDKLFATPTIAWREHVQKFFTARTPAEISMKRSKVLIGMHSRGEDAGRGAYLPAIEHRIEKVTGIAEIFFLVDTSGSMGRVCGDGQNIFVHIMTELIELEARTFIKKSAYACFNGGEVKKEDIIRWTNNDAPDEDSLKEIFGVPSAKGGTDVITAISHIVKYTDIYNIQRKPYTLLVIVTDGEDNYANIGSIMSEEMLRNTIVIITQQTDEMVDEMVKRVISGGFDEDNVIGVNYVSEWGEDVTTNRKNNK